MNIYYACMLSLSCVQLFVTPQTVVHQAPLTMGILQARILSWLPCAPPEGLPNPWVELALLTFPALAGSFFTTNASWEAQTFIIYMGIYIYIYMKKWFQNTFLILYHAFKKGITHRNVFRLISMTHTEDIAVIFSYTIWHQESVSKI